MEDYAAKMALKSDAALREYVAGHTQYREGAVLAALDELQRRGLPAPEDAALRPSLAAAVQEQLAAQAKLEKPALKLAENEVPEDEQPVLYTPGVIVLFSVLFTIVSGALLLAANLRHMKRPRAAWGVIGFALAYFLGEVVLVSVIVKQNQMVNPLLLSLLNLPAILAYVLWVWPRYVSTYQFQSRNWLKPLMICFIIIIILQLVLRQIAPPGTDPNVLLK